jgi:hypothetical protein
MNLNPEIWGPLFWFFLHTISFHYPLHPNDVIKKKYYDFIMNLPIFIPVENMSNNFTNLLNLYPVSPYLDDRNSLISWTHFIHNKINEQLEKPTMSLEDFYIIYYNKFKPVSEKRKKWRFIIKQLFFIVTIILLIIFIWRSVQ